MDDITKGQMANDFFTNDCEGGYICDVPTKEELQKFVSQRMAQKGVSERTALGQLVSKAEKQVKYSYAYDDAESETRALLEGDLYKEMLLALPPVTHVKNTLGELCPQLKGLF